MDSSTDSENEDDEGVLASGALDAQFQETLEAIRRKDPRVYDEKTTFYTEADEEPLDDVGSNTKPEKPMYLGDYHRRNLLEGAATSNGRDDAPLTYAQEQDDLKRAIINEMHAFTNDQDDDRNNEENFLTRKASEMQDGSKGAQKYQKRHHLDVESADNDPETYLSTFMSARAWVPSSGSNLQPFESDDEEEERRAELFEEAYNLRFEDPKLSNEKLLSHARDAAAKYSVRKEETNPRKKARDAERAKKGAIKQLREEEKARLRKLKVAELEEKIQKIKDAAGLRGKSLRDEDWSNFLDEGWDNARWEMEMKKRFGDDYYADRDSEGSDEGARKKKKKVKKPKWEDDIDINDLVPDFDNTEGDQKPAFELTDDEAEAEVGGTQLVNLEDGKSEDKDNQRIDSPKGRNQTHERDEWKTEARQERRKIERLVDEEMNVEETLSSFGKKHAGHFRYRETSPSAFGLTAHDILMASDSQLNQYAGLKKMAAFRDSDKKRKDKKSLGKKARLRQWRKDTFGSEQGPRKTLAEILTGQEEDKGETDSNLRKNATEDGKTRKKRSKHSKAKSTSV